MRRAAGPCRALNEGQGVSEILGDQDETIALLARPESYGLPATTPVERIDTHGAIVFLAGDRAYKLKRAVRFSYMDFSTVELRRRACEAEVTLNGRTAPRLYLEAAPVTRASDGALCLGGRGETVDWVVVMRRFEQSQLFDRMAETGALTLEMVLDLAEVVVGFHDGLSPEPASGGLSGPSAVADSNALNLRLGIEKVFNSTQVERLAERTEGSLTKNAALIESRRAEGKVRRCHGDLHLRNVCLFDGRPTLFDCVEFNAALATVDVLYDLAFLLMDLWHRGLEGFANGALNRYLDLAHEDDGLGLLGLYMSLRAAIRAHVGAATLALQPVETDRAVLAAMGREARAYLTLAERFLSPPRPRLVAIGGLSGSGKSTLAYGLAPAIGAAPGARVLRSDMLRKELMGVPWREKLAEDGYGAEVTARVYASLAERTVAALNAGQAVIADAVFARPEQRRAMAELARTAGVPFHGLWLEAPIATLERRVASRQGDASDADVAVLRQQLSYDLGPMEWTKIDVGASPEAALAAAHAVLAAGQGRFNRSGPSR
jgi:hypothetical protein